MTNHKEQEARKDKWRAGFEREGVESVRARAVHKRPIAYGVPEQWAEALDLAARKGDRSKGARGEGGGASGGHLLRDARYSRALHLGCARGGIRMAVMLCRPPLDEVGSMRTSRGGRLREASHDVVSDPGTPAGLAGA